MATKSFWFIDHNNPGYVYLGTEQDFQRYLDDGYYPRKLDPDYAKDCVIGGTLTIRVKHGESIQTEEWECCYA